MIEEAANTMSLVLVVTFIIIYTLIGVSKWIDKYIFKKRD